MKFKKTMSYSNWVFGLTVLFYVIFICKSSEASVVSYSNNNYDEHINPAETYYNNNNNSSTELLEYARSPQGRSYRQSKFFPLFTIVRFTTEVCRTTNEEHGICQTKSQCANAGGIAQGNCAQGIGVCCRYVTQCGGIVTQNGTAFQNPGYPSKYSPTDGSNICQIRVRRQLNVCQLRLNFIAFDIDGPTTPPGATSTVPNDAGTCKTDSLAVTSSGGTIPSLCGNLNNQHIYVEYGSSDTITLNLLLSGNVHRERQWNIEIYMIPCNSQSRAPPGCLQYFTGISGQVQSFNFQGGQHLSNMDYSTCIRPEDGMRFIDWTPCTPGDVRISGPAAVAATMPTPCLVTGLLDYLIIMGGVSYPLPTTPPAGYQLGQSTTDRFCDTTWPASVPAAYVRSSVRPFLVHFRSDGGEVAGQASAAAGTDAYPGFCLRWQQNPQ